MATSQLSPEFAPVSVTSYDVPDTKEYSNKHGESAEPNSYFESMALAILFEDALKISPVPDSWV